MTSRLSITLLVMMMTNAVLFGVGAIVVLSIPALKDHVMVLLPVVIVTSFLLGPLIAWYIAPRLRGGTGNREFPTFQVSRQRTEI